MALDLWKIPARMEPQNSLQASIRWYPQNRNQARLIDPGGSALGANDIAGSDLGEGECPLKDPEVAFIRREVQKPGRVTTAGEYLITDPSSLPTQPATCRLARPKKKIRGSPNTARAGFYKSGRRGFE